MRTSIRPYKPCALRAASPSGLHEGFLSRAIRISLKRPLGVLGVQADLKRYPAFRGARV